MASLVLEDVPPLARRLLRSTRRSTDWVAAGRSADGASWTVETLSNARAHLVGAHHLFSGWAGYWPRRLRSVRQSR